MTKTSKKIEALIKEKSIPSSFTLFYLQDHLPNHDKTILIPCKTYEQVVSITEKLLNPIQYFQPALKELYKVGYKTPKMYYSTDASLLIRHPETGIALFNLKPNYAIYNPYNNIDSVKIKHSFLCKKSKSKNFYLLLNMCKSSYTEMVLFLNEEQVEKVESSIDNVIDGELFDSFTNNFPEMFVFLTK